MTRPDSRVLRYPGSSIRVEAPGGDLRWLVQFLGPSFQSRKSGVADWSVRMDRDSAAFRELLESGADPRGRRRPTFFLDTRMEALPLWEGPEGSLTVHDRVHGLFASVESDGSGVRILAPEGNPLSRLGLMRVVREHALSRLMSRDGLLLHASAFVIDGQAILIVGEKRSGKSSLLLHSLWNGGGRSADDVRSVRFLANDRVWVASDATKHVARGFPTISSLRVPSLAPFPEIAARLEESTWATAATLAESRLLSATPTRPWNGRKYAMSPLQLCRLLEVRAEAKAPLGAILFPTITGARGRIRATRMALEEAAQAVHGGLFRAGISQKAGGLFAAAGYPRSLDGEATTRRIRRLVEETPCFSVELGLHAYSDRSWLERLPYQSSGRPS